jgi:flagellar motility protein MotE (MotC chaperone)
MKKLILYILIVLLSFAGTVAICLAVTGNLSMEGIGRIIRPKPAAEETPEAPREEVDPYLQALQRREEDLKKREASLQTEEAQLKKSKADLEQLRTDVEQIQKQIGEVLKTEDAEQVKRDTDVALSLSKMKPTNASTLIASWEAKEAARVLRLVKDKERGKILDAMTTDKTTSDKAAAILLELQNAKQ